MADDKGAISGKLFETAQDVDENPKDGKTERNEAVQKGLDADALAALRSSVGKHRK